MSIPTGQAPDTTPRGIAKAYLRMANDQYRNHYQQRIYFAQIARQHGLTNQEIADEYGVTEGAVRKMLQRHEVK